MATFDLIARTDNGHLDWYQRFDVSEPNDLHADLEDRNDLLLSALADVLTDATIERDWSTTETVTQIIRFDGSDDLAIDLARQAGLISSDSLIDCVREMRELAIFLLAKAQQIETVC